VRITQAAAAGSRLGSEKGINLPDTALNTPSLTAKDLADLKFAARHADIIGMSFVRTVADIEQLWVRLDELGAANVGTVLKIENREAFENLPRLLLSALTRPPAGVMVARGDLAIELGFERLAEVQEQILWLCEAAHVPVIWATQVLDTMARSGTPSRAEVTDAVMSGRAECVMLNKGPYMADVLRLLTDILKRMSAHQSKKRSLLRPLSISRID
jgi:pyruvate kinase